MNEQARRRLRDARDACDRIEWETLGRVVQEQVPAIKAQIEAVLSAEA